MKLRRIQRKKGELNLPLIYLMVGSACALFIYSLYLLKRLPQIPCVFKTVTGYPCPTCGSTRAVLDIFHLDIVPAFLWNPLVVLGGAAFIAWVLYGFYMLFAEQKVQVTLTKNESRFLRWGVAILFVLNWIYLIAAGI